MAVEEPIEPIVARNLEFSDHLSLAVCSALFRDVSDPIEHQHRRQRQLGIAGSEHAAVTTLQQIFELDA